MNALTESWTLRPSESRLISAAGWYFTRRDDPYDDRAEYPIVWFREDGSAIIDRPVDERRWFLLIGAMFGGLGRTLPPPTNYVATPALAQAKHLNYYYHDWWWTMTVADDLTVEFKRHESGDEWPTE